MPVIGPRLRGNYFRRVVDFHLRPKPNVQCLEHLHSPFKRDPEIFVPLISRHLRLMDAKPPGQFPLRHSLRNPHRNQQVAQSTQVIDSRTPVASAVRNFRLLP